MPDGLQTIKTKNTFPWVNNISKRIEQIVTTEAVLSTDFGLNKQHSHKPTMYFTSDASSTTKTVPDVTYDLLKNISSTLPSAIEDNETVPKGPFQMPLAADLIWTFIFGTMIGCAILGNLVVIWIVLGHRRMQNVTNYFLVSLSFADLMMSCLNTIFNFTFMKNRNWVFGSAYCTINNFIAYLSVAASVFTLMAISIDRYIAIVRPLKPRMTKPCARIFLGIIWSSSVLISLPTLMYSKVWTFPYKDTKLNVCFLLWPDGPPPLSKYDYVYNIVYFSLTYLVPIIAMGICYGKISLVLWGKSTLRENACNDHVHQRKLIAKRKVVKMFIAVVIIFAICWLPYHMYFIVTYHYNEVTKMPLIQHVYLGFYWLAMANSMINPCVYYWMNSRFRSYIKALVSSVRLACCHPKSLLRRSYSRSSLDIGVIPFDQNILKVEIHRKYERYSENARRKEVFLKKEVARAMFPNLKRQYDGSRNRNGEKENPEPASQNSLNVELKVVPCPPFPSPAPTAVTASPHRHQNQQFYSIVDVPTHQRRKKRRDKRKWRSSGESNSKYSSNSSPDQDVEKIIDRDQEIRNSMNSALQKNCTYNSNSDVSIYPKCNKGKRFLSAKFSSTKKTTHHFKKNNSVYKSTSQITTCSPLSTKHSQKASSAMELDLLSRKQFRSVLNHNTKPNKTIKASSRLNDECFCREFICPTTENEVDQTSLLNEEHNDIDNEQTSGRESSLSYYTGLNEEPVKNVIFHPLLPSLSSSLKQISGGDKCRSYENSDTHNEKQRNTDIFATPLKSMAGDMKQNKIVITVEISPEPSL